MFFLIIIIGVIVFSAITSGQEEAGEEAVAEEVVLDEQAIEQAAGITPDNPLYIVDTVVENINLGLRRGEDKTAYALQVNREKISEAKLMADKADEAGVTTALGKASDFSHII